MFLTGKKENVDWALYKLGQYVETRDDHNSIFIIGNDSRGVWTRTYGLAKINQIVGVIDDVMAGKSETKSCH
jgi:protein SCO1/2